MNSKETEITPIDENERSLDILSSLQNCAWFSLDPKDETQVLLYHNNGEGYVTLSSKHFSIDDFLKAVDFYCANRQVESLVNNAMQRLDGAVKVYTGHEDEALRIVNYRVPQILEFAYRISRRAQETNPLTEPQTKPSI
jgi:hypothetical protein